MGSVFISYAHDDEDKAYKIKERLEDLGFTTWFDRTAPASRDDISTVIDGKLGSVDCVLVLWSSRSKASVWVRGEALKGLECNKYFGILLEDFIPPVPFNALAAPDLSEWTGLNEHLGWDALVRGLADLSANRLEILQTLSARQKTERETSTKLVEAQAQLPLEPHAEPEEARVELDEAPQQDDIEAIVTAARSLIARSAKLDLSGAMTQAVLDFEMLRDAAFVVSKTADVPRPTGSKYVLVSTISEAVSSAAAGALVVIHPGRYEESIEIKKDIRVVGLGLGADRPVIVAKGTGPTVVLDSAARLENLSIETRHADHAIQCDGGQPSILRCDIRRFANAKNSDEYDAAFYVAMRANPIVISSSIASTGCRALLFVSNSGGLFIGVNVVASRGDGMTCKGRPEFQACTIEAIGAPAVRVLGQGSPTLESCELTGRGYPVIYARNRAYPRISGSRVNAIRQLAFDFDDNAAGRYEGNIVSVETGGDAGTKRVAADGFFARFKSKQDAMVRRADNNDEFARLRGNSRPLFIANTAPDGRALAEPITFSSF
ncbi:MAG: TIR domain-containing protein [Terricaulis sp.]